jgi:adenylosuccinate synthase
MNRAVIGTQWGDEGKGKIVDMLAADASVVARWGGGANAGHTIVVGTRKFVTHLLPTGAVRRGVICVLGAGMAIDPWVLVKEIKAVERTGVKLRDRLHVFRSAHLVLPCHIACDSGDESPGHPFALGTTKRGIGPAYADKASRAGLRAGDLDRPDVLLAKVERLWHERRSYFDRRKFPSLKKLIGSITNVAGVLAPHIVDGPTLMRRLMIEGHDMLFEGAQGILLDVDLGTYPFVTSSSTGPGGLFPGLSIPWYALDDVVGVVKAYTTRVGRGPFPTELHGRAAAGLRGRGGEYGATTRRARRCGWLDLVALRYAVRTAGVTSLAMTKLDVLDAEEKVPLCVAYEFDGSYVEDFVPDGFALSQAKPVYEYVDGWKKKTGRIRKWGDLPKQVRTYVQRIEEFVGAPVSIISNGPRRSDVIRRR